MPMDLRKLELFVAVVDSGGFTAAAEAVHVAQPSVSQAIRELEREVQELRRANEILRKASAYFAVAELDRRPK